MEHVQLKGLFHTGISICAVRKAAQLECKKKRKFQGQEKESLYYCTSQTNESLIEPFRPIIIPHYSSDNQLIERVSFYCSPTSVPILIFHNVITSLLFEHMVRLQLTDYTPLRF